MKYSKSMLSTFVDLLKGVGGVFDPSPADPKKARKAPRTILASARPLDSKHHFHDGHGSVRNTVREYHRDHALRTKKQRRIARGSTDKVKGPRGGRIRKRLEKEQVSAAGTLRSIPPTTEKAERPAHWLNAPTDCSPLEKGSTGLTEGQGDRDKLEYGDQA